MNLKNTLVLLLISTGLACSGPPAKKEEKPKETGLQPLDVSKCLGDRVPPSGWKQATSFEDLNTPDAAEVVRDEAIAELRDRICQGYRCGELEPMISLWNTEADAQRVCAMAVIKSSDVAAFQQKPRLELRKGLDASAVALAGFLDKKKAKIAIDNVRDNGVDGGSRAEWLIDRMNASLSRTGTRVAKLPKGWSGLKLPQGVDGVLRGRITRMHGRESMLEITWTLDQGDSFLSVDPVRFPEFIGPNLNASTQLAELPGDSRDLSVRFDARPGGGLCNGQKFEMTVETAKSMHVRVLNLYGDEALLIYGSDGPIKAGKPTILGQFMAFKAEGIPPAERFIAFGASNVVDLEDFGAAKTMPCRIPKDVAGRLNKGRGLPSRAAHTSRGYRIVEGEDCKGFTPPSDDVAGYVASLPACW